MVKQRTDYTMSKRKRTKIRTMVDKKLQHEPRYRTQFPRKGKQWNPSCYSCYKYVHKLQKEAPKGGIVITTNGTFSS